MPKKPFAERVVFVPLLHLISFWHYVRKLRFPLDLLTGIVFILTGVVLSGLIRLLPASLLVNLAALYLVVLVPTLFARWLCQKQK